MKKTLLIIAIHCIISISFGQNHAPTAVNDTAHTFRGTVRINVLHNDFDMDGDSIKVYGAAQAYNGSVIKINDSILQYTSLANFANGIDSFRYTIKDNGSPIMSSYGWVYIHVDNSFTADSLNINNINAGFNADGDLFWWHHNPEITSTIIHDVPKFEVPKGSGKRTIFAGNLWVGGKDNLDSVHVAGQLYNENGRDFWAGPVSNVYDSAYNSNWNRIWKIKKSDIDYHLAHCWEQNYVPPQSLIDWPGNRNTAQGQTAVMFPFKDYGNDGIYNPYEGDYPIIKGDETVYFIFNDDRYSHTESSGHKLGIEVHAMAYSFKCSSDSALWNTIFINYKIYNRSSTTYDSTFFGAFIDTDIGNAYDDYIGCDVDRSAMYGYNGKNIDDSGQYFTYGAHPPAQAVVFLAGPKMDNDGIDNPAGLCDEGVTGVNFGNGIIDDERYGMTRFIPFGVGSMIVEYPIYCSDPYTGMEYYHYLKGLWRDGSYLEYGETGYGHTGAYGPPCKFMFPGKSDFCHWGTAGMLPNGVINWTEQIADYVPDDRRLFGSSGPFTFKPGDMQELDLAFVFGRDYVDTNATAAITVMNQRIDSVRKYFRNNETPCGGRFSNPVTSEPDLPQLWLYPNPTNDFLFVEMKDNFKNAELTIYNVNSQLVLKETLNKKITEFDISKLRKGMYFIKVRTDKEIIAKKFIKE